MNRPTIVCLCGSTRFWQEFQRQSLNETLAGKIVLSIGAATGTDDEHFGNLPKEEYDRVKAMLDELHLRKIDLADEVLILNVAGYIGESTRRELEYARATGKRVRFLEPEHPIAHGFLEPDAAPAEPATGVDYRKISAALATAIHRAGETQRLPVFIYCKQAEGYHKTFYTDELTAVGIKWLACREWVQFIELAQEVTLAI